MSFPVDLQALLAVELNVISFVKSDQDLTSALGLKNL